MAIRSLTLDPDAGKRHKAALYRAAYFIILILSCAIYLPSLMGLAIWDDHTLLSGAAIGGGHSFLRCFTQPFLRHYFRPLVSVSFCLDHKLWGTGPFFYHQTNILLHVVATAVLMNLLRAVFSSRRIALVGGLLFAAQPAQVSTVAWIGGRTDSLCALWVALFGWTLVRAAQQSGRWRWAWLAASTLAFGASLLTKEQALLLILLVPLAFRCFASQERNGWYAGLPFVAISIAFIALWLLNYPEPFQPLMHRPGRQFLLGGWSLTYYTLLLLLPTPKWMHTLSLGALEQTGAWTALCGYAVAIGCVALFIRWWSVKSPRAWFLALIALNLLPVSNIVPVPSLLVAPYRAGVAGLGAAALLAACIIVPALSWLRDPAGADRARPALRRTYALAASALLVWYAGLTGWGVLQWRDDIHLFETIVRYDPDSIIARYNLATYLAESYRTAPAATQLERLLQRLFGSSAWRQTDTVMAALHRNPRIMEQVRENQGNRIESIRWMSSIYAQLGAVYLQMQDTSGSLCAFHTSQQFDRSGAEVNLGLGCWEHQAGNDRLAARYFRLAIAANSEQAQSHAMLGKILASRRRWPAAYQEFRQWVRLQPWLGTAYASLADAQIAMGDRAGARATLQHALRYSICNHQAVQERIAQISG